MDLFSENSDASVGPVLAAADWKLEVEPAKVSDFGRRYVAIISRGGEALCCISIDPFTGSELEARQALAKRAYRWVREFQTVNLGEREPGPPTGVRTR